MRVVVLVKTTETSERDDLPAAEMLAAMGRFNDELRAAGVLRAADGLSKEVGNGPKTDGRLMG